MTDCVPMLCTGASPGGSTKRPAAASCYAGCCRLVESFNILHAVPVRLLQGDVS